MKLVCVLFAATIGCSGDLTHNCPTEVSRQLMIQSFVACFDTVKTSGACTAPVSDPQNRCVWRGTMTGDVGSTCEVEVDVPGRGSCKVTAVLRRAPDCEGPRATFVQVDATPSLRCYQNENL